MQANVLFSESLLFQGATKSLLVVPRRLSRLHTTVGFRVALAAAGPDETSTVDYSSTASVFPAEACDTIGGEACNVEIYPEVKPVAPVTSRASVSSEEVERDYMEYNEPKTVFLEEACDDLGGEFCEAEYQKGVSAEKTETR